MWPWFHTLVWIYLVGWFGFEETVNDKSFVLQILLLLQSRAQQDDLWWRQKVIFFNGEQKNSLFK
jgi:hypothetical protein